LNTYNLSPSEAKTDNISSSSASPLIQQLLDSIDDYLIITDEKGLVTQINQSAQCWIGEMDPVWYSEKPLSDLFQILGWNVALLKEQEARQQKLTKLAPNELFANLDQLDGAMLHIRTDESDALQLLKVKIKRLNDIPEGPLTLIQIKDLSNLHRKELMDRLFFHDIRNTVTEILGFAEVLTHPILKSTVSPKEEQQILQNIGDISRELADEVDAEKKLLAETSSTRSWKICHLGTRSELERLAQYFDMERRMKGFLIDIDKNAEDLPFTSVSTLLRRVLINIFKNACQASKPGDLIRLGCRRMPGKRIQFWIKNPAVISEEDRQRFLSVSPRVIENTHGLGTHSIRILTERFLHGSLIVDVDEKEGTCLRVTYPQDWPHNHS